MSPRILCGVAALYIAISVATGAWGAHALAAVFPPEITAIWNTAADYQQKQGIGLLALAAVQHFLSPRLGKLGAPIILVGSVLFSFSLYLLVLKPISWVVYITPLGGMLMIIGWLMVGASALMPKRLIKK